MPSDDALNADLEAWLHQNNAKIANVSALKVGFVFSKLRDWSAVHNPDFIYNYLTELYGCLEKSPFLGDISSPEQSLLTARTESDRIALYAGPENSRVSLMAYIKMRLLVPEPRRTEIFSLSSGYESRPDQFTVYFDGSLFVALSQGASLFGTTDIGHIAGEVLEQALSESGWWESKIVPPCPMGPDIYLVSVLPDDGAPSLPGDLSGTLGNDETMLFLTSETVEDGNALASLLRSLQIPITTFYEFLMSRARLEETVQRLQVSNRHLNALLSEYFGLSSIQRLFAHRTSTRIKEKLGELHQLLLDVARDEVEITQYVKRVYLTLDREPSLRHLRAYCTRLLQRDRLFDNNSCRLPAASRAAEETVHFSRSQATVFAALLGGAVAQHRGHDRATVD